LIVAGGDVSFGREVGQRVVESPDYAPFAGVAPFFCDADVRFVNLESQLSEQQGETQSPRHRLIFTGPPEAAGTLARAGVQVVSTANNHAWDYGRSALFETLEHLRAAGVRSAGTGRDAEEAYRPAILRANGLRVALFALTHVWNQGPFEKHEGRDYVAWASFGKLRDALLAARASNDVVLVSYHGGAEYQDAPSDLTRAFVKAVIEAGADAVIGHHPHVIQGIGWFSGRPVFYSLGNLVFGRRGEHPWTRYGMLARMRVSPGAAPSFSICPYRIDDFLPVALSASPSDPERARFLGHVRMASTAVGGIELGEGDELGCVPVAPVNAKSSVPDPLRAGRAARSIASR
jgi:poly-gamma-glutamate synthesis protein (capsule biosynthesis protein)